MAHYILSLKLYSSTLAQQLPVWVQVVNTGRPALQSTGLPVLHLLSGPKMGFSPLAAKLLIGSKKVSGVAKMARTSSITMPSMVIICCALALDEKVRFFCLLSRFGMTKFVITETLWCSVIFKTVMASLHRGRSVVVHLYSTFFCGPKNFPLGENL